VATTAGGVCQLQSESMCSATTLCQTGLVCGSDGQCRSACTASTGCAVGDYCVTGGTSAGSAGGACYAPANAADLPALVQAGVVATDGAVLSDASTVMLASDATTPPTGDGSPGTSPFDAAAESGPTSSGCVSAQTQFQAVAQGDSNPSFNSGVGVRGKNALYIFSGYSVTQDGGTTPSANAIYAQAFDPKSGAQLGTAQPLLQANVAGSVYVWAAAVAPGGQIAVLYTALASNGTATGLQAAFLDVQPGDAGPFGLQVEQTAQLEAERVGGQPQAIWSNANQAFAFSWLYYNPSNGYYLGRVSKFTADGNASGGGTDTVPTDRSDDLVDPSSHNQAAIAAGGGLMGVAFCSYSDVPYLTVLTPTGNEVGSPIPLGSFAGALWITAGGTPQGFVAFYADNGVDETFVPATADGGVSAAFPSDGGDAGALSTVHFSGNKPAVYAHALNDDVGGANGVGVALLFQDGVSFAYVNSDGLTYVGPDSVLPHAYTAGDFLNISNYGGSFGLSVYSSATQSTQVVASGCQ
jgi:hypothetical protein